MASTLLYAHSSCSLAPNYTYEDVPALKYFCPVVAYLVSPHLYVLNLARSWKKPGVLSRLQHCAESFDS